MWDRDGADAGRTPETLTRQQNPCCCHPWSWLEAPRGGRIDNQGNAMAGGEPGDLLNWLDRSIFLVGPLSAKCGGRTFEGCVEFFEVEETFGVDPHHG